ncbi:DNA polymerase Y family protein [Niabella sp. W65]|nr:DNA polymerase Y family protein [Niabella sp. W65]MCH7366834.1 DNA polymerase Y family protein [Niabella sp. W65]
MANRKVRQDPALAHTDFVIAAPVQGKMVVKAVSPGAKAKGIKAHMVVADCKTMLPQLEVFKWEENSEHQLLKALGAWCIRFSPVVAIDPPDGLIIETTGCTHLWGGEALYLQDLIKKFSRMGYQVRVAIAGTIGTAWGMARFCPSTFIVPPHQEKTALLPLPPAALRLETPVLEKLSKLGMHRMDTFINMPGSALRRRFGDHFYKGFTRHWVSRRSL